MRSLPSGSWQASGANSPLTVVVHRMATTAVTQRANCGRFVALPDMQPAANHDGVVIGTDLGI